MSTAADVRHDAGYHIRDENNTGIEFRRDCDKYACEIVYLGYIEELCCRDNVRIEFRAGNSSWTRRGNRRRRRSRRCACWIEENKVGRVGTAWWDCACHIYCAIVVSCIFWRSQRFSCVGQKDCAHKDSRVLDKTLR